ncbi:MAG: hypothetical protein LH629_05325, partial [Ignavibacteria bacterium]|nr:hypothetical protein [Ignavibacteria bacterium]
LTNTSNIHSGDGYYLQNDYDKDGNLKNLLRRDSAGNDLDKFSYHYVSGTNKLDRVKGIKQQYRYDLNGNMIKDSLNSNYNILYDYRNLIIQLSQRTVESSATTIDTSVYTTYYYYDETGNRIRKKIYKFVGSIIPAEEDTPLSEDSLSDLPSSWEMYNDEIYSKGVDGKDLCIYKNGEVEQWNIYGLDNVGKLQMDGNKLFIFYYLKDHLGSVRATVDDEGSLISSEDYDAWGYKLKDRSYQADEGKFKFTGKERDKENSYDYFGARYYDARVANWTSVDPLMEKHFDFSPYNYVLRNPFKLVDPDGRQVEIITRTYIPQESSVNPLYKVFHDNRSADYYSKSYRTEQRMVVVPNQNVSSDIITSYSSDIGTTFANPLWNPLEVVVAPGEGNLGNSITTRVSESSVNVSIQGQAWETLIPGAPSIDYSVNFYISENSDGTYNVITTGTEDGFPAYEIWARNLKTGGSPILIYNRENGSAYELPKLIDDFYDVNFRREEILK